jgi:glyoxylase-like metal-dependent hydrolase (beta-lactamase superfamily II)
VPDRLYFRQLLSGQDFARDDQLARQMVNFAYLIGDRVSHEAVIVDPAYRVGELVDIAEADGMTVVGALATHFHPDHVGGSLMGYSIEGVAELLARTAVPIHANRHEAALICQVTGASAGDVIGHDSGEKVSVGAVEVELLHTPGHTPGSQCFLLDGMLVSGDTLFLEGCGRTDLPGSDPAAMYESLRHLASLPDDVVVYPGHHYSTPASESLSEVRSGNVALRPVTQEQWLALFAR